MTQPRDLSQSAGMAYPIFLQRHSVFLRGLLYARSFRITCGNNEIKLRDKEQNPIEAIKRSNDEERYQRSQGRDYYKIEGENGCHGDAA